MPLIIEQSFPLGRFHATRWKMGAFGDPYGEWPPSPWRLLRALANRWFQWSRETGGEDRNALDRMLLELSKELPEYYLPVHTTRGKPLKQYLPVGLEEKYKYKKNPVTKKSELDYQYRDTATTLTDDAYRLIASNDSVFWVWQNVAINDGQLLDELLARVLYFGRAESWTRLRRIEQLPSRLAVQSVRLHEKRMAASNPVLAPDPQLENRLRLLFEPTDHSDIGHRDIPPGTRWYYAALPSPPRIRITSRHKNRYPENLTHIQFTIGGQVLPTVKYWCLLTEQFRKRALRELCRILTGNTKCDFPSLDVSTKSKMRGFTGKDEYGEPLADHSQAYFAILPDGDGKAARLIVWRHAPFSQEEVEALLAAARFPLLWDSASPKWKIKLLPLPFEMPLSIKVMGTSHRWESVTPFVLPRQRRRFRKNGKRRPGETPESIAAKLCQRIYGITPLSVTSETSEEWPYVHVGSRERGQKNRQRMTLPSFRLVIEFAQPVAGPIALGDSSHFGLGVFRPL